MGDKKTRSIVKALSWRVIAVIITFVVSLIITGKLLIAGSIGLLDSLIKIFAYYFHERTWDGIKFGKRIS